MNCLPGSQTLKYLPTYDGNPYALKRFIESVEEILLMFRDTDQTPRGKMFLRAIRNKIKGKASELLDRLDTPLDWDEIKRNLTRKLLDNRDALTLIEELHEVPFRRLPITKLYDTILDLKRVLTCMADSKELPALAIIEKKNFYMALCLKTFIKGLTVPLRNVVKASRPNTLDEAFVIAIQERDEYMQERRRYPANINIIIVFQTTSRAEDSIVLFLTQPRIVTDSAIALTTRLMDIIISVEQLCHLRQNQQIATHANIEVENSIVHVRLILADLTIWKPLRSNLHNLEETVNFQRPASESRQGT